MEVSTAAASPGAGHTTTVVVSSAGVNAAAVPHPDHVVIAMMENHPYSNILGNSSTNPNDQDPYIRSLAAEGASFTNSYGVTHPSLPNYYAFLSGSDIVKDNTWPAPSSVDTPNLPNELATHGYSFGNYTDQGVPNQWLRYTTTPGTADHLNPIDKRLEDFPSTPAGYASLPTVSLVVGNGIQSMHDGTIAQGDAWVQSQFGTYINWARTHNSLFVLTWDEDDFTPVNHVATIFYGPMVKAGSYDQKINHYNVLRTVLDMYGLPHINHTADVSTISGAWDLSKTAHMSELAGPAWKTSRRERPTRAESACGTARTPLTSSGSGTATARSERRASAWCLPPSRRPREPGSRSAPATAAPGRNGCPRPTVRCSTRPLDSA
jgi:acid phosphatase